VSHQPAASGVGARESGGGARGESDPGDAGRQALGPGGAGSHVRDTGLSMKTFTLDEAEQLLPTIEALLKRAMEAKQAAEEIEEDLQQLGRRIFLAGGMMVDVAAVRKQRAVLEALVQRAKDAIEEIDAIGVQVKDLSIGLLDFPAYLDGEIVLLCWKL